ncbi:MAG: hypothetical protein MK120_00625 [Puniceicoccaceae bacterium]|nr:hypothetical protein [Puniceicoccaceae bacterium]
MSQKIAEVIKNNDETRSDASISLSSARMDEFVEEYGFIGAEYCGI